MKADKGPLLCSPCWPVSLVRQDLCPLRPALLGAAPRAPAGPTAGASHLLWPVFSLAVPGAFCQPGGSVLVRVPGLPGEVRMAQRERHPLY